MQMRMLGTRYRVLILLVLSVVILFPPDRVSATSTCSASQSPSWQICGPIETLTGLNEQASVIQASDGTLRMAWTHVPLVGSSLIYYAQSLPNGTFPSGASITGLGGNNYFPAIVQASNGTIIVFWAYKKIGSPNYQIYYRHLKGTVWSPYAPVPLQTPTTWNDTQPSAAVDKSGTLWLVWTRDNSTVSGSTPIYRQLWYETLNSTGWSKHEQSITLTSDADWNFQASILVGKDGVQRIAFSRGQSILSNFQINYISRTSSGWTAPRGIIGSNSTADDMNPSLIQDRNGTLWVFFTRNTSTNFAIREASSIDNGTTWGPDTLLTAACSGCADSEYSVAVQFSFDKKIYVYYSSNPGVTGFDIWSLVTVNPISPVHDVAMLTSIGSYGTNASEIYAGGFNNPYAGIFQSPVVILFVTIRNLGDFAEPTSVGLTATNATTRYSLGNQTVVIPVGNSDIFSFLWNTSGVRPARYGLSATASIPVEPIGNRGDNSLVVTNIVHLLPLGDVDQDGSVTITDVGVVFYNYGFSCYTPTTCSPRYNPFADVNGNGIIDIVDIGVVSKNFDIFT